nr:D-alanine-D-alanine ligase-related ATP-grasp enzyme-like protein [uncultured bacterium]
MLSPAIASADDNIEYYYDFTQSIAEYTKVFAELKLNWQWQPVTMATYRQVIENIEAEKQGNNVPVVLNLCDGDEVNGTPGVSVVKLLEEKDIIHTGADEYFYNITTSKIPMKIAFDEAEVPNAPWKCILDYDTNCNNIFKELGKPLIIKPAVSGGSMGVGIKNIVETRKELYALLKQMFEGYRGWNLTADGIVAEKFITGREFTVLISGSYDNPDGAFIYTPVERVFHASLPEKEKFLSFDRLWEIYEEESAMPGEENFYEYQVPADAELVDAIKKLSWDSYCATKGKGYTRVDIRMDSQTSKLYVLEVNAQCGISEDENYTSIGAILRFEGKSFSQLIIEILNDAFIRFEKKVTQKKKETKTRRKIA